MSLVNQPNQADFFTVANNEEPKQQGPTPLRNDDFLNLESKNKFSKLKVPVSNTLPTSKESNPAAKNTVTQDSPKSMVKSKILFGASVSVFIFSIVADILIILVLTKIIHYPFLSKPSA